MYWPTASAKRLHLSPSGLDRPPFQPTPSNATPSSSPQPKVERQQASDEIFQISRSRSGLLWASLSGHTLTVWSTRPSQSLAAIVRTQRSLEEYGFNSKVEWRPDGRALMIEASISSTSTDKSFILLYDLVYFPGSSSSIYSYIPSSGSGSKAPSGELLAPAPTSLRNSFSPGAGESASASDTSLGNLAGEACELRFRLVLSNDAGLCCSSGSLDTHLLVSTRSPPAIQCIKWPSDSEDETHETGPPTRTSLVARMDWVIGKGKAKEDVRVEKIIYSRPMDVFVWITSDGRAYVTTLTFDSRTSIWKGKCFHGAPKRRRRSLPPMGEYGRDHGASELPQGYHSEASISLESPEMSPKAPRKSLGLEADVEGVESGEPYEALQLDKHSTCCSINARFSLIAIGQQDGTISIYSYRAPGRTPIFSHRFCVRTALKSTASYLNTGPVRCISWTGDGYALAVGWESGFSVWSTYGKLMACTLREDWETASKHFSDSYMFGVRDLFWGPGNTELFVLSLRRSGKPFLPDNQLFILPFSKSAVAGQHSPDNTRYAFYQSDDSVHVYRGADQPDMSVINPESDVWHHIQIPKSYLAANWPIRYASISSDGRLIAVAGRRGLAHYSISSGRWKTHANVAQEQSFVVRGGLQWYQHVLIAACDCGGEYQLRLYSRDTDLDSSQLLDLQVLSSPVVLTSLFDNSLLVYTSDNTFYHFLIELTNDRIKLRLCGSITFEGVVGEPARVRGMSWMIPPSQQRFGDPIDDLTVATVIFLIDGKLVLLRPRKSSEEEEDEVAYDMQILGDKVEYYWTHLQGIGTLENSLWGYDGNGIKLWLDALTIEHAEMVSDSDSEAEEELEYKTIEESVYMPLDFYPLCVLLEKGIVIGIEPEATLRKSLDFAIYRTSTNTHLFLHQILRNYLEDGHLEEAVFFASYYQSLVYFAHALEILLHAVLEDEADAGLGEVEYARSESGSVLSKERSASSLLADVEDEGEDGEEEGTAQRDDGDTSSTPKVRSNGHLFPPNSARESSQPASGRSSRSKMRAILPLVVDFLDHFDESLQVVVGCARKTEVARWGYLFDVVGKPIDLFEKCLAAKEYKTAGSYLLVLHNLEPLEESTAHTVRLLRLAVEMNDWNLCKDLLRFVKSIDESGHALREAIKGAGMLEEDERVDRVATRGDRKVPASLVIPPGMNRSSSAPSLLDTTLEEEEEESPNGDSPTRPPVPEVTVNGRITMPPRRSSGPPNLAAQNGRSGNSSPTAGLGMSLSRVGLRSTERLWDGNSSGGSSHGKGQGVDQHGSRSPAFGGNEGVADAAAASAEENEGDVESGEDGC
ncbi:RIC1-domain-containing protein [Violaceomyces palustris]|uniref:RIC1-domain-containing protein n=1 Tax=Violaceomyces palustris TaxID=1673888 RepID=A0ACD0P5E1_9BASI|nr:RIC1-domain-containing protein [Violaceomyces palustris]